MTKKTTKNPKTSDSLDKLNGKSGQEILDQIEEGVDFYFFITLNKTICVFAIKEDFDEDNNKAFVVKRLTYTEDEDGFIEEVQREERAYEKFSETVEKVSKEYGDTVGFQGHNMNCRIKFVEQSGKVHTIYSNEREDYHYYFKDDEDPVKGWSEAPLQDFDLLTGEQQKKQMAYEVRGHARREMEKILPKLTIKNDDHDDLDELLATMF